MKTIRCQSDEECLYLRKSPVDIESIWDDIDFVILLLATLLSRQFAEIHPEPTDPPKLNGAFITEVSPNK